MVCFSPARSMYCRRFERGSSRSPNLRPEFAVEGTSDAINDI